MIMTAPSCTGTRSMTSHPSNGESVRRLGLTANPVFFRPSGQRDDGDDDDQRDDYDDDQRHDDDDGGPE